MRYSKFSMYISLSHNFFSENDAIKLALFKMLHFSKTKFDAIYSYRDYQFLVMVLML